MQLPQHPLLSMALALAMSGPAWGKDEATFTTSSLTPAQP